MSYWSFVSSNTSVSCDKKEEITETQAMKASTVFPPLIRALVKFVPSNRPHILHPFDRCNTRP